MNAAISSLGPLHYRRHGRQDRLHVAAGLEAEGGATVVEEVELHVAAAADELLIPLRLAPWCQEIAADDLRIDLQKGTSHVLGEGEGGLPAAVGLGGR